MAQKGDIHYILPFDGSRHGYRAAVIVSGDQTLERADKVSVAYLSSRKSIDKAPTHVAIRSSGRNSWAILEGVTTLPKARLGEFIGHATEEEIAAIDAALCVAFDL